MFNISTSLLGAPILQWFSSDYSSLSLCKKFRNRNSFIGVQTGGLWLKTCSKNEIFGISIVLLPGFINGVLFQNLLLPAVSGLGFGFLALTFPN